MAGINCFDIKMLMYQANPFICGHRGHAGNSCGIKMLTGFAGYPWFKGSGDDVPAW